MAIECNVIDAGARYGLHPSWADLASVATFHLFEMESDEAERLTRKYAGRPNIHVHPLALYSQDTVLNMSIRQHRGLTSLFDADDALLRRNDYFLQEFEVLEAREVAARSIDSLFSGQPVHFLKLDVEGAELEIMKGAQKALQSTVLGVRSEVLFSPLYIGAPLFGALNEFMLAQGFELLNLDYTGGGNATGQFTMPGRYGKLVSSDAVWIISNDRIFSNTGERLLHDVVRIALFLMNNSATDLAIDILDRAVSEYRVDLACVKDDVIFKALHKKVLILFKSLLSLPQLTQDQITSTYQRIFGQAFPIMNQFYETGMFD